MQKRLLTLLMILIIGIGISTSCQATAQGRRDYAVGWQFSRAASGLSLKIPVRELYYIQPVFAYNMVEKDQGTDGHVALSLRGIYDLPTRDYFHPYAGMSVGYSESFNSSQSDNSTDSRFSKGLEGFFGVEYQKYLLRPALEIGMGGFKNSDNSYNAGLICNFSILYYF